jgi:hypothetical protein
MRTLVEELCSDRCAGRAPGTPGGIAARSLVVDALRHRGLDPVEQPVPGSRGANVLATLNGTSDRWVLVAAHYDHLGTQGGKIYRGADDNAAAVAILVETAGALARARPSGRGVLVAAFDAEEPPYYLSPAMGSMHFAANAPIPLERIDMMVCMDLVGHSLGSGTLPAEVSNTVFALGSERSAGTGAHVDALQHAAPGVVIRRADAEIIPPLSDYAAFWDQRVPFLFLTCGRSRYYHTPEDTPDRLDYAKMAATARWLERFVRETCERPVPNIAFLPDGRDDASTLRSLVELTTSLAPISPEGRWALAAAQDLLARCDRNGRLPVNARPEVQTLTGLLESGLA